MPDSAKRIAQPEKVAVTIYNENLALIREVRELALTGGNEWFELPGVSGQLRPNTVHLSLPEGVEFALLEQNFDYDLVNQVKLLEKFIGREITVIDDENNNTFTGKLLNPDGPVLEDADGRILLDLPGRVVLPEGAADELLLRPTLSWLLWR